MSRAFDRLIPDAEELWAAGKAEVVSTEIEPGRTVDIPYFDPLHTENPTLLGEEKPFITKRGRRLGTQALYQFEIDGIDYVSRVMIPNDEHRTDHDFTIVDGTAWCTTIDGYEGDRNAKLFVATQAPLIATGAPHSGRKLPGIWDAMRLPQTIKQARGLSLAYSAQVEQKIAGYLTEKYDLPTRQFKIGDSRADNNSPGHFAYAAQEGTEIIGLDVKGHCMPNRVELRDMPAFGSWLVTTTLGGIAAIACLAKNGELETLKGSTSFNPNFVASALTGTLRSLASGETGRMIDWVPRHTNGIDVLYGLDWRGGTEAFEALWHDHPNIRTKMVPGGTHGALLHPVGHTGQNERMTRAVSEHRIHKGDVSSMNWTHIHGVAEVEMLDQPAA